MSVFDLTCSICTARGVGTYEVPVVCLNCAVRGRAVYSRGHEAMQDKCPVCGTTRLAVDHTAAVAASKGVTR
jgi:DnaJ-class molecular chaperone